MPDRGQVGLLPLVGGAQAVDECNPTASNGCVNGILQDADKKPIADVTITPQVAVLAVVGGGFTGLSAAIAAADAPSKAIGNSWRIFIMHTPVAGGWKERSAHCGGMERRTRIEVPSLAQHPYTARAL